MKNWLWAVVLSIGAGSGCVQTPNQADDATASIRRSAKVTAENVLQGRQRPYRYFQTDDQGAQAETRSERRAKAALAAAEDDVEVPAKDRFAGSARAQAKTTVAHAKTEA